MQQQKEYGLVAGTLVHIDQDCVLIEQPKMNDLVYLTLMYL